MDDRTGLGRVAKTHHLRLKSNADIPVLSVVIMLTALRGLHKTTEETDISFTHQQMHFLLNLEKFKFT